MQKPSLNLLAVLACAVFALAIPHGSSIAHAKGKSEYKQNKEFTKAYCQGEGYEYSEGKNFFRCETRQDGEMTSSFTCNSDVKQCEYCQRGKGCEYTSFRRLSRPVGELRLMTPVAKPPAPAAPGGQIFQPANKTPAKGHVETQWKIEKGEK